jgi:hypothetical protein
MSYTIYSCADAPELALMLLNVYTDRPPKVVVAELQRFLWNGAQFGECVPLALARAYISKGAASNFVYHQRTGHLFTGVSAHPLLLSYLEALDRTDFRLPPESVSDWGPNVIYDWNATSRLADEFVERGHGLYLSSTMKQTIFVDPSFRWTAQETAVFRGLERRALHDGAPKRRTP